MKQPLKEKLKAIGGKHLLNEGPHMIKFANYLEHLDQLAQDLKYWALKAIPHRKKDINDALKLYKQLYKKVDSLMKDVKEY